MELLEKVGLADKADANPNLFRWSKATLLAIARELAYGRTALT